MADFKAAIPTVLRHEGVSFDATGNPVQGKTGWVNHVDDPGGETNYGITKAVAMQNGFIGDMKDIPYETVLRIYKMKYWDAVRGDGIPDQRLALELFDTAVNAGVGTAVRFLQRVLNVHNKKGTLYPDVPVDGRFGNDTWSAFCAAYIVAPWYAEIIREGIDCLQGAHYIGLAEKDQKFETFTPGWFRRRVGAEE